MIKVHQQAIITAPNEAIDCKLDAVLVTGEEELERIVIAINGKIIDVDMQRGSATVEEKPGDTYRFAHMRKAKVVNYG